MKKVFLVFVVMLLYSDLKAQPHKFKIAASFQPGIAYRTLKMDEDYPYYQNTFTSNIPKFNYEAGIELLFEITNKYYLSSGIYYSNLGYKDVFDHPYPNIEEQKVNASYLFIDIPLYVGYNFVNRDKYKLHFSFGISYNRLLNRKSKRIRIYTDGEEKERIEIINKFARKNNISNHIGIKLEYFLTTKISISAKPEFRYMWLPVDEGFAKENVMIRLWDLGINFGVLYDL